jgi:hypothetical protein
MARGNRSETVALILVALSRKKCATTWLIRELLIALTVPIAALC